METYMDMLQDSLRKKLEILDKIMTCQKEESDMLKGGSMDRDVFDRSMTEKVELAESIDSLDDGFEKVYDRIREEMIAHKEGYVNQIRALQNMISEISEKNVLIDRKSVV